MYAGFFDEKVRMVDCLSRIETELIEVEEVIEKTVASAKDINV